MSDGHREWNIENAGEQQSNASQLQPLYLLADSQLLFWKQQDRLLLEAALDGLSRDTPLSAAYIGASNGDRPEFYEIFEAAMDAIGITDRRMIDSSFGPDDRAFLERAQLIVLAGGDVRLGWHTFEKTGMKEVILGRDPQGGVLVGLSVGAVPPTGNPPASPSGVPRTNSVSRALASRTRCCAPKRATDWFGRPVKPNP